VNRPNTVLIALITGAAAAALAVVVLAAEAHGRRRARRWPREWGAA